MKGADDVVLLQANFGLIDGRRCYRAMVAPDRFTVVVVVNLAFSPPQFLGFASR